MNLNILLIPLLAGFVFVSTWNYTKFYILRYEGNRLFFYSALAGLMFLITSTIILYFMAPLSPKWNKVWDDIFPFLHSGKAILSLFWGLTLSLPLNRIKYFRKNEMINSAIIEKDDAIEILLRNALGSVELLLFTLKNSKIYIAYVVSTWNPAFEIQSIKIMPIFSGYRDGKQLVHITTDYQELCREAELTLSAVQICIPVKELLSVGYFKTGIYYGHIDQFAIDNLDNN